MKLNKSEVDKNRAKLPGLSSKSSNIPLFWQGVNGVVNLRQQNQTVDKQEKLISHHLELAIDNVTLSDFSVNECHFY